MFYGVCHLIQDCPEWGDNNLRVNEGSPAVMDEPVDHHRNSPAAEEH